MAKSAPGKFRVLEWLFLGWQLTLIEDLRVIVRKRLFVLRENDRCVTDANSGVTGVRLGKRSLKFLDDGKVAVTFLNLSEN